MLEKKTNEESTAFVPLEGTPFATVKRDENWVIITGNAIASRHKFENAEEAEEYVNETDWELLTNGIIQILSKLEIISEEQLTKLFI